MLEKPDMTCVPYARKSAYHFLTIPFMVFLLAVFVYLWTIHLGLAFAFLFFYVLACVFQAYCCAYQDCPYIGGWCPAIAGIMPASFIARWLYGKKIKKTEGRFAFYAAIAFCGILGMGLFPLYWLGQTSLWLVVLYLVVHVAYYLPFLMIICPKCAIRNTCPGGRCHQLISGK